MRTLYGYEPFSLIKLGEENSKLKSCENKGFSNNASFLKDYMSYQEDVFSFASTYIFYKKKKNDWFGQYDCQGEDNNTKTFFNVLSKDNHIAFAPSSWKEVFSNRDWIEYDIANSADFKSWVKMYKTIYYWYYLLKNEDEILNTLEIWYIEDEFKGIHSITLIKNGEVFDNLKLLKQLVLSKKYAKAEELKNIVFHENYNEVRNMFKEELEFL